MTRYHVFDHECRPLGTADSAQHAADIACAHLQANPGQTFAYARDTRPEMVYPFTRYVRSNGAPGYIGTTFRTLGGCLWDDDGSGFHVETFGGGRFTSVAWFPDSEQAHKERNRLFMLGAWSGMPPRVTKGRPA